MEDPTSETPNAASREVSGHAQPVLGSILHDEISRLQAHKAGDIAAPSQPDVQQRLSDLETATELLQTPQSPQRQD